jgi:hypothetical protein
VNPIRWLYLSVHRNSIRLCSCRKAIVKYALCGGPASTTQTPGTGSGNAADTASRVLSAEMDGVVKALILEMEQVAGTGRSCQAFVVSNGFGALP